MQSRFSMAVERERFYECEVKRLRVRAAGGYEPFWKVKAIEVALEDNDTEFRCMNCGGAVKLFKRRSEDGPAAHIEHKLKSDSEYCSAGIYFLKATDGRQPRLSTSPVR
jgi:hypothetical protein